MTSSKSLARDQTLSSTVKVSRRRTHPSPYHLEFCEWHTKVKPRYVIYKFKFVTFYPFHLFGRVSRKFQVVIFLTLSPPSLCKLFFLFSFHEFSKNGMEKKPYHFCNSPQFSTSIPTPYISLFVSLILHYQDLGTCVPLRRHWKLVLWRCNMADMERQNESWVPGFKVIVTTWMHK